MNRHTVVYSDHQPPQYFMSQPKLLSKQQQCLELLAEFFINVQYRPSKYNILPDVLSQQLVPPTDARPYGDTCLSSTALEPSWLAKVYQGQQSDVSLSIFLEKSKSADSEFLLRQVQGLFLLYRHPKTEVSQLVILNSKGLRQLLLEEAHCTRLAGHIGACKAILAPQ